MLKLNVGANRKVQGDEQFSSKGFSCNLEVELGDGLLNDTPALRAKIEELFTEARDAVEKQINGNGAKPEPKDKPASANGNNGDDAASQKQLSYLMSLGRQRGMSVQQLADHAKQHAGKDDLYELTKSECSKLIDTLK